MTRFDLGSDVIDIRDLIAHIERYDTVDLDESEAETFELVKSTLEDLSGCGGDEEWRGDWYPVTLIRDSYFEDYARELADDIGAVDRDAVWPNNCIDWEKASRELRQDYSSTDIDGVTYWYR